MHRCKRLLRIRRILPVILLLLLTSCGKSENFMEKVTELYSAEPEFEAQVKVVAELSDNRQEYVLHWEHRNGYDRMTVLEPELIAGISAETKEGRTELVYDGMVLELEPSGTQLSPLEAVPELFYDWSRGICMDHGFELLDGENTTAITYSHKKHGMELRQRVWFDCESMKPLKAEIYTEDRLTADFEFQLFDFQ